SDVLRRLLEEGIPIRDLRGILEALADAAQGEKDPVTLTELVRVAHKRFITHRYAGGGGALPCYLLDPQIEEAIRGAIQRRAAGSYLALEPGLQRDILEAVKRAVPPVPPADGRPAPVIVTSMELRRFVRRLVELERPRLAVLSFQELAPELALSPVG